MHSSVFLIAIVCLPLVLATIPFSDCGSKVGKINSITLNDCQKLPCVVKKGTFANFTVNFTPNKDISAIKIEVWGKISPLPPVPFNPGSPDGCKNSSLKCPLKANTPVSFKNHLEVKKMYPTVSVINRWQLTNEKKEKIICFDISLRIVD
ncbi:NPC intracellular cholesterol transporter 2 homolog a-like [Octopus sinensis]|uniref:NPC intracellular cholesterol transporter 2 homolog a-like n=1 Tax=Octopus sinensis TaxID=2607531 RepID=A0A6P7SY64_9MOLL|nr:NPC intracellular cholesterol transporter 2 homolog a-like [Octopus sinensis]